MQLDEIGRSPIGPRPQKRTSSRTFSSRSFESFHVVQWIANSMQLDREPNAGKWRTQWSSMKLDGDYPLERAIREHMREQLLLKKLAPIQWYRAPIVRKPNGLYGVSSFSLSTFEPIIVRSLYVQCAWTRPRKDSWKVASSPLSLDLFKRVRSIKAQRNQLRNEIKKWCKLSF